MTAAVKGGGGGFDVDSVLNFEKRSGIKDGEIETFISKVDAVNAAIQAMKARRDYHAVLARKRTQLPLLHSDLEKRVV